MPKQTSRSDALGEVVAIKHALLFRPTVLFGPAAEAGMAHELSR